MAFVFYISIFVYGIRKEVIPRIPIDLLPPHRSRSMHSSNASNWDNDEQPNASSSNIIQKNNNFDSNDDESDEGMLEHPISNVNLVEIG